MDETLTPVNDGQVSDESSQVEAGETVNAEDAEVTTGEQTETTEDGEQGETAQEETAEGKTHAQSKEENSQFAKVRREAEAHVRAEFEQRQATRDAEFAKRAAQFGWVDSDGAPIKTESAYWQEVDHHTRIEELVTQGKDPEIARAIVERDELKNKMAEIERGAEIQAKKQTENAEFFDFFKEINGREFKPSDTIPTEVFQMAHDKNIPLKYAYAEHVAKVARDKEKNIALGKQTTEANAKNAKTSPGSVDGAPQSGVMTEAEINAHADDTAWMMKNYDKVTDFYRNKKG